MMHPEAPGRLHGAAFFARLHEERADVVLSMVFSHLGAAELAGCLSVCRYWLGVGKGQELWRPLCEARWADKAYVPASLVARAKADACGAYGSAELDAPRTHITCDELCRFAWETRMKGSSGPGWTSVDPWWSGGPPRTRRFHADGRVDFTDEQRPGYGAGYVTAADLRTQQHPAGTVHRGLWRFLRHNAGEATLAHAAGAPEAPSWSAAAPAESTAVRWREDQIGSSIYSCSRFGTAEQFCGSCASCCVGASRSAREGGSCLLRLSLGAREFPTMVLSRASNWGFVMQNCWGVATSFPLPKIGTYPELEDESEVIAAVSVETQRLEAAAFNAGLPLPNPPGCFLDAGVAGVPNAEAFVMMNIGDQVHRVPQRYRHAVNGVALMLVDDDGGDGELLDDDSDASDIN
ncbi:hypothetical protein T492DRAFT_1001525 [Pavlovales sp. CCMP2436]|nr:hypothetical protein T492DRAFT_1001525 [Pavlovales sp. CCMP2436]